MPPNADLVAYIKSMGIDEFERRFIDPYTPELAMPPVSKAQNALMQAAKSDPKVAKRVGVPQSVAREFTSNLKPGSVKKLPEHKKPKK